ncbi:MAG: hypothetical protein IH598_13070 [Bacteroidales bacterium]|nr:hypothetical protein [Bacteroidales bacterium]
MKESVKLSVDQCHKVAEVIRHLNPRQDFYRREYLTFDADPEIKFRMHFFAVAICHHTYSLHHPGLNLWGWDFIEHVFLQMAKVEAPLLNPDFIVSSSITEICNQLKVWFTHDEQPENCSLDRLEERAELMLDAGRFLTSGFQGSVVHLFNESKGFLINEGKGLYEILPKMEAFSDPLQKKSTFLIKLLMDADLIQMNDPENFIPIMDYHMQRVLMRTGCVEITDQALRRKLIERKPLSTDEPIRSYCIQAFKLIAKLSGHPVTRMNDYFWSLGRSCCNNSTLCHDHQCEKEPCTLSQIIELDDHETCIFASLCPGTTSEDYRKLWQPIVETHYY